MNRHQNNNTQPHRAMKIFNNWEVVANGWYIACKSKEIAKSQVKSLEICGQRLVIFRGEDRKIRALDAYCPHLGTDLGIGKIVGNTIRCFFHHWQFDENGDCTHIPSQTHIPPNTKLQAYATAEKYGFIWVYPQQTAPESVAEFNELQGKPLLTLADKPFERPCHHHICMMNGIDAQHLQTVHQININMDLILQANPAGNIIDFTLRGQFPNTTLKEKIGQKLLGETYEYTMRYADGCLGLLTILKNVKYFPPLHMIYAYTPVSPGKTRIQPIYITQKRAGIIGWIINRFLLLCTRLAYYALRGEDGQIYDNIRFNPKTILKIDTPLVKYMEYVNKLEPSPWSKVKKCESVGRDEKS